MPTGTLTPTPYQTVLDSTGISVSGALINTYLAGTLTPAATYTDVNLTVANANPIVADSAGRYVAFLPPGVSYKYVITTSAGVAIKTTDNISSVPLSNVNLDITGTAGEALTAGQAVYLSDGSGSKVAGSWYKADATNGYSSSAATIVGMVPASITSAASGTIRLAGEMTGLTSLTVGSTYYIGTAGAITLTPPANRRSLGEADSTSSLVLAANPGIPNADNGINDFRLTLTTAVPVTTADVTAATTIYCTPSGTGNRIALFDSAGTATIITTAEFSIAVPATTSQMYDIFAFSNVGVATLELLAWTNDTTRATALVLTTTGVYTKSGDLTRRYLGSFRTTAVSGQTEDSVTKRYLWNYYRRMPRLLQKYEATTSWAYTTATVRQANGAATNQVDLVVGIAEVLIDLALVGVSVENTNNVVVSAGIGEDATTTYLAAQALFTNAAITPDVSFAVRLLKMPAVGRHFYAWNEWSTATGTTTWKAVNAAAGSTITAGLTGWIDG